MSSRNVCSCDHIGGTNVAEKITWRYDSWYCRLCCCILPTAADRELLSTKDRRTKVRKDESVDETAWDTLNAHYKKGHGHAAAGALFWQCDNRKCVSAQKNAGLLPREVTRAFHCTLAGTSKTLHWNGNELQKAGGTARQRVKIYARFCPHINACVAASTKCRCGFEKNMVCLTKTNDNANEEAAAEDASTHVSGLGLLAMVATKDNVIGACGSA